jgi:hypothetical protein
MESLLINENSINSIKNKNILFKKSELLKYTDVLPTKTHLSFKKPVCGQVLNDKCCNHLKEKEYSLTSNFFDPNHHSPPNDFLIKLQIRINEYYKKESNLFSE